MTVKTAPAVRLPRAINARGQWIPPSIGTRGICPECGGEVTSIISDHYRAHFRHIGTGGGHHHGPSSTTQEHFDAQAALIDLLDGYNPRQEVVSQAAGRRADVMITFRGQQIVVEVQRSTMSLADMEDRTRDWNTAGVAVLWVFTASMLDIDDNGNALLGSTARHWAARRGWQQCYVVGTDGTLWWVDLRREHHVARPIRRGMRSLRGHSATIVTDRNTSGSRNTLIVAAFAWETTGTRTSPFGATTTNWVPFGSSASNEDTTPKHI